MEITSSTTQYHNLKRYWRSRKYQRLNSSKNGKKLKIARLGAGKNKRRVPKLKIKTLISVSPLKILTKLHDAYVDIMIRMANKVGNISNNSGLLKGKRVAKAQHISMVSSRGEEVDNRLLLEIYHRLAASRDLSVF